jgi:hypothetical protein
MFGNVFFMFGNLYFEAFIFFCEFQSLFSNTDENPFLFPGPGLLLTFFVIL